MEDGYQVPIRQSLTNQILLSGVPRTIALLNGTLAGALGLGMQSWFMVPICIVFHILAVVMTKRDPQFFDCFKRHINQKSYYST